MQGRVLVDGHNAMHRLGIADGNQDARHQELVRRVAALARVATVFFDARKRVGEPVANTQVGGVRIVYCVDREADHEILAAVREADAPRRLLVVSDDREVAGRARQLGARATSVSEFFGRAPTGGRAAAHRRSPREILESLDKGTAAPSEKPAVEDALSPSDFGLPDDVDLG